mmetsp:Transcript_71900/g.142532  ORF Transcript_71900/g.142532 Transcript_71900/m.142532 type:complete len:325 (-) Transcript_71900:1147-2121(-)
MIWRARSRRPRCASGGRSARRWCLAAAAVHEGARGADANPLLTSRLSPGERRRWQLASSRPPPLVGECEEVIVGDVAILVEVKSAHECDEHLVGELHVVLGEDVLQQIIRDSARARCVLGLESGREHRFLLLKDGRELLGDVGQVGHRVRLGVGLHIREGVFISLVQHKAELVELDRRARVEVGLCVVLVRGRLLDAGPLDELTTHDARVLLGRLEGCHRVISQEVLDDEDAPLVLRGVGVEAGHETQDLAIVLHHPPEVLLGHLGDQVEEGSQRVLFSTRRHMRRYANLWPLRLLIELYGDVVEADTVDLLVVVACELVAAVD